MDLLERADAAAVLDRALARSAQGHGTMVLVGGEAGAGKTALLRDLRERHAGTVRALEGACDALRTPRPLGPLLDLAREAGGTLARRVSEVHDRHELFAALLEELARSPRPVLAVIEDAHWADEATLDLLLFLARRVERSGALVVVTYRDDESAGAGHPLRGLLGRTAGLEGVVRLHLPALSPAAVRTLAAGSALDPEHLHAVTGGNPFFVTEVLAADVAVPSTVRDAVLARTARLPTGARRALDVVAVVPGRVERDLVLAVEPRADIDVGEEAGLLRAEGRHVAFRHELARLAVEDALPTGRRVELHRAVLARLSDDDHLDPARAAFHADGALDAAAVLRYAPMAAAEAAAMGAHREAARQYALALRHGAALPVVDRARLLERHVEECAALGAAEDALAASAAALELWRSTGDRAHAAAALARRSLLLWAAARNDEAHDAARDALAEVDGAPDGPAVAEVCTWAAYLRMLARDIPGALSLGRRAVTLAERHADARVLSRALNAVGAALWFAEPDRAEQVLVRAVDVARAADDQQSVSSALVNLGSGAGEVRRYATAERWLDECRSWCVRRDLDANRDYATAWLARTRFEQGDWRAAETLASGVAAAPGVVSRLVALTVLGRLRTRRGDGGAEALDEAWSLAVRTADLQRLWPVAAARAEAAWLDGRGDAVADLVVPTLRLARERRHRWAAGELATWLARVSPEDVQPTDGAGTPYEAEIDGRWADAAVAWAALGCPWERAQALVAEGSASSLTAAADVLQDLGARRGALAVAARLRALGAPAPRVPHRSTAANAGGLTDRELDVARLLTDGLTNAEIAATLHISAKTAGHHVSAILAKLGVGTRREAARVVARWSAATVAGAGEMGRP